MHKNHIRSYRITNSSDVEVVDRRNGETVDLSNHYNDMPHDRGGLRLEACLEVFRVADGQLIWSASPNGHDNKAAASLGLLLKLYLEDLSGAMDAPRAF